MSKRKRKGPGKDATSAESVATKERHAEWIELRRKGWNYRAIAAKASVAQSTVHEAITKYLHETVAEPAAGLRQLELERLDALLLEATGRVEVPSVRTKPVTCSCGATIEVESADDKLKAIEVALKIGDQRAKLLGLNAPTKVMDVTPPREDMWARVRAWLKEPSPELEAVLAETGWRRKAS